MSDLLEPGRVHGPEGLERIQTGAGPIGRCWDVGRYKAHRAGHHP